MLPSEDEGADGAFSRVPVILAYFRVRSQQPSDARSDSVTRALRHGRRNSSGIRNSVAGSIRPAHRTVERAKPAVLPHDLETLLPPMCFSLKKIWGTRRPESWSMDVLACGYASSEISTKGPLYLAEPVALAQCWHVDSEKTVICPPPCGGGHGEEAILPTARRRGRAPGGPEKGRGEANRTPPPPSHTVLCATESVLFNLLYFRTKLRPQLFIMFNATLRVGLPTAKVRERLETGKVGAGRSDPVSLRVCTVILQCPPPDNLRPMCACAVQ